MQTECLVGPPAVQKNCDACLPNSPSNLIDPIVLSFLPIPRQHRNTLAYNLPMYRAYLDRGMLNCAKYAENEAPPSKLLNIDEGE